MRKFLIIAVILLLMSSCSNQVYMQNNNAGDYQKIIDTTNDTFGINIPYGEMEFYNDNRGGFHGDGAVVLIISLSKEENNKFLNKIDSKWMNIDQNKDMMNCLWGLETLSDNKPIGGLLNKKITSKSDMKYKLLDVSTKKMNEEIELGKLLDFCFVSYSSSEGKIYIQDTFY